MLQKGGAQSASPLHFIRGSVMADFIVGIIISAIVGVAAIYIAKQKKKGVKCIGCPDGAACSGSCGSCGGACHSQDVEQKE